MNLKQQFKDLSDKLLALGESPDEFGLWLEIFDDLPQDKQIKLVEMASKELDQLQQS